MRLVPRGLTSVLDIGARDGHFSRLLLDCFSEVTALDLEKPCYNQPGITEVAGDVTSLEYPDGSFDCVFCAEVLEHVPAVDRACREILRVARHDVIVGVPFRQDIRCGRTTCGSCGGHNPPWGHVNAFDERRLMTLFAGAEVREVSFVGATREATTCIAAALMNIGGNPWGTYEQEEPCVRCGEKLLPPPGERALWQRICSGLAVRLNRLQSAAMKPHANWLHVAFTKPSSR